MEHLHHTTNVTVARVLDRCLQTVPPFRCLWMGCVSCAMAAFDTLAELSAAYGLRTDRFLNQLQRSSQPMEGTR